MPALMQIVAEKPDKSLKRTELNSWPAIVLTARIYQDVPFTVYFWDEGHWEWVYKHTPQEICDCGRSYNKFKCRDSFGNSPTTKEEVLAWLALPILCQFCYYKNCIARGEWAPKAIRQELGLEN